MARDPRSSTPGDSPLPRAAKAAAGAGAPVSAEIAAKRPSSPGMTSAELKAFLEMPANREGLFLPNTAQEAVSYDPAKQRQYADQCLDQLNRAFQEFCTAAENSTFNIRKFYERLGFFRRTLALVMDVKDSQLFGYFCDKPALLRRLVSDKGNLMTQIYGPLDPRWGVVFNAIRTRILSLRALAEPEEKGVICSASFIRSIDRAGILPGQEGVELILGKRMHTHPVFFYQDPESAMRSIMAAKRAQNY
ncbi:MAG TPA: hypothetical protein VJB02_04555 [Coxiellaceae bacterium]|nr:hypothetical protein [Coxiellaceae bacterium]